MHKLPCGFALFVTTSIFLWSPAALRAQSLKRQSFSDFSVSSATVANLSAVDFSRYKLFPCSSANAKDFQSKKSSGPPFDRPEPQLYSIEILANSSCGKSSNHRYLPETTLMWKGRTPGRFSFGTDRFVPDIPEPVADNPPNPSSMLEPLRTTTANSENQKEGFHWWPALQQSFNFLLIEHGFRIADDPFLRYLLWHKPLWHDWAASDQHFYFNQWGDGDDFLVNYIGHPMEGGVTGNIEILNDPKGRSLTFGRSRAYWMSRLRAMAFAAVYSAQFEAGPILSEAAIGNEGGYFYKPGCDPFLTCSRAEKKPITNNTGWVDFVVTPVVGMGWIVLEDAIETELVDRWAKDDDRLRWKILRASLSPTHVMSNFVAGKTPWYRYRIDGPDGGSLFNWHQVGPTPKFSFEKIQRWEIGAHYAYLNLPVDTETCSSCRVGNSGFGANFAYRITNRLWFDSDLNFFPGSGSFGNKGSTVQAMFGPRYGHTAKSWGLYFKLRPGFIYYDKTLTADSAGDFTNATRFAFDVGSIFEWYASRHSVIRFDAGTTVVRYLTGRDDPRQPPGNILSTDYIVSQSNFQIGTGYTYRF
jgi:hypothetical protein